MGGVVKKVVGSVTGLLGLKPDTSAQDAAIAEQGALLKEQEADIAKQEEDRLSRISRSRQGRRSLLYKEGDEAGVKKSTTLGS